MRGFKDRLIEKLEKQGYYDRPRKAELDAIEQERAHDEVMEDILDEVDRAYDEYMEG